MENFWPILMLIALVAGIFSGYPVAFVLAGIGILIDNYRSRLQAEELFASIVLASLLGVAVFWFFGWLGNRIVGRWYQN